MPIVSRFRDSKWVVDDDRMKLSAQLRSQIQSLIHDYFTESSAEPAYLKILAERYQVLPLYVGWTAFYGLRLDGEIVLVPTEEEGNPQPEFDERLRRMAIFRGTKKYPDLKPLVPERPADALSCTHCEGWGRIDIPGIEADTLVCYCGGLGWLTQEEVRAEPRG
jgi:hypothetical protein